MKSSYKIWNAFGIPIRVHLSLVVLFPILILLLTGNNSGLTDYIRINPYLFSIFIIFGLFTSVALHELGHSLVGIKCGYRIKEIVLLPIGGVAKITKMTSNYKHEILVAIAGPLVSLVLAAIFFTAARLASRFSLSGLDFYFFYLFIINLVLALFNLLPSFPMDGGRVLRAALTPRLGALEATRRAAKTGQTLALLFGVYSLFWGSLWNMLIAIYIHRAAGAEYRMMRMRSEYRARFQWDNGPPKFPTGARPVYQNEISVSPPPYADEDSAERK